MTIHKTSLASIFLVKLKPSMCRISKPVCISFRKKNIMVHGVKRLFEIKENNCINIFLINIEGQALVASRRADTVGWRHRNLDWKEKIGQFLVRNEMLCCSCDLRQAVLSVFLCELNIGQQVCRTYLTFSFQPQIVLNLILFFRQFVACVAAVSFPLGGRRQRSS